MHDAQQQQQQQKHCEWSIQFMKWLRLLQTYHPIHNQRYVAWRGVSTSETGASCAAILCWARWVCCSCQTSCAVARPAPSRNLHASSLSSNVRQPYAVISVWRLMVVLLLLQDLLLLLMLPPRS
jgi:hypothetical protein